MKDFIKSFEIIYSRYFNLDLLQLAGHNGPYYDKETPARNVAHWILILSRAYKETNNKKYKNNITELAEYLYSQSYLRPYGSVYLCRLKPGKDLCNGLIGNAWVFEGLVYASKILGDAKYSRLAESIALKYKYDFEKSLFYTQEIDGVSSDFDYTFNHQLWFVMSLILINQQTGNKVLQAYCEDFFKNIERNLRIHNNGLIIHGMNHQLSIRHKIKRFLKKIFLKQFSISKDNSKEKEVGYHAFNTYAFSVIKESGFETNFWSSLKFKKILQYLSSSDYQKNIVNNKYGYTYNPPGYEVMYTKEVFRLIKSDFDNELLYAQINKYLISDNLLEEAVKDVNTQVARFYEASRLKE